MWCVCVVCGVCVRVKSSVTTKLCMQIVIRRTNEIRSSRDIGGSFMCVSGKFPTAVFPEKRLINQPVLRN